MGFKYCVRCGEKIGEDATVCPHCSENAQMYESAVSDECRGERDESKKCDTASDFCKQKEVKKRTLPIFVTAAAPVIILAMLGFCIYQNAKLSRYEARLAEYEAKRAEDSASLEEYEVKLAEYEAEREEEQARQADAEEYYGNMESAVYTMLDGLVNTEKMGNLVQSVWSNAIYERSDDATDPYTKINGYFVDDFNVALSNLFESESFTDSVGVLSENKAKVVDLMKKLNDPPEKYAEAYSLLMEYYGDYTKMVNAVMNPTGSFNSFTEDFEALDKNAVESYEKLLLYLE